MSQLWGKGHNRCCPMVVYPGTNRIEGARIWALCYFALGPPEFTDTDEDLQTFY